MNGLDLFSGIGGLALALEPWVQPIAYCENDRYAQSLLLSRMRAGLLPLGPIWDDVRSLSGESFGDVDIISGGFPCQDISSAGRGAGMEQGSRSGLFFEIVRLVQEVRPTFVFLENVPAIRTRGLSRVLSEFTALGYDCRWTVVSAAEVSAPHLRKRWFLLAADAERVRGWDESGRSGRSRGESPPEPLDHGEESSLADAESVGSVERGFSIGTPSKQSLSHFNCEPGGRSVWWAIEPDLGRVAHGVSHRVDRLRGLGNAVVPLQARVAFQRLLGIEER